ncbi:hypothetical protein PVAP13_8KG324014 [Panicum virgatum]|uniref:Uncharacterized protein n=1 Tax=Panicum virgatum TaxID=38727 RepID=A0A8T0PMK4_PANVG|nr:hypothetical protein PVAP13_8KG324014 [Panicum virgatum]
MVGFRLGWSVLRWGWVGGSKLILVRCCVWGRGILSLGSAPSITPRSQGTRQHFDELFWSFGPHPYHLVGDGAQQSTCLHAVTQIWKHDVHMSLFYIPLLFYGLKFPKFSN